MKRTSSKDVYNFLLEIDQNFDTSKLKFHGVYVWPIVRSEIAQQILNPLEKTTGISPELVERKKSLRNLKIWIKHYLFLFKITHKIKKSDLHLSECTYVSRVDEMKSRDGNSIIGQGIVEMVHTIAPASILSLDHPLLAELIRKPSRYYLESLNEDRLGGFDDLQQFLATNYIHYNFNFTKIVHTLSKVWAYKELFEVIFKKTKCRFVFFSVYFHPISFAISLAANNLEITSVEVQHGQQGKYSPLNLGMKQFMDAEYKMLPDIFWAWGETSKKLKIEKSRYDEKSVIVAGNPTLFLQSSENTFRSDGLLIALQKLDPLLPPFVFDFIMEYPDRVIVRLHPHMDATYDLIHDQFKTYKNVEVQKSTQSEIYNLIRSVRVVLTNFSSVVIEAASLGKLGVVVHNNAFDLMEDNIANGEIFKAINLEELRSVINKSTPRNSDFIETNIVAVRERLRKLLTD